MALAQEDMWLGVAALGAVAFGYWWFGRQNTSSTGDNSGMDNTVNESGDTTPLISGMSTVANNVVTPNEVFSTGVAGYVSPGGAMEETASQVFPIAANM